MSEYREAMAGLPPPQFNAFQVPSGKSLSADEAKGACHGSEVLLITAISQAMYTPIENSSLSDVYFGRCRVWAVLWVSAFQLQRPVFDVIDAVLL